MKKIISIITAVSLFCLSSLGVCAQEMKMYVRNQYVVRDVVDAYGFDMLPIADIAGELGYQYFREGNFFEISSDYNAFYFYVGSASVSDRYGNLYGLDVVPQEINGKLRIPSKFVQDVLHMSYVWDSVTNTIFMGSEDTYNWLRSTPEYKATASGAAAATSSPAKSYSCYPGSGFRTFTDVSGISASSVTTSNTGSKIYDYGYVPLDIFYSYIAVLQNDGLTYTGAQEADNMVIVSFWGANDSLLLLGYDTYTGTLRVSVS